MKKYLQVTEKELGFTKARVDVSGWKKKDIDLEAKRLEEKFEGYSIEELKTSAFYSCFER